MKALTVSLCAASLTIGCHQPPTSAATSSAEASQVLSASAAPATSATSHEQNAGGKPCGPLACRRFDSAADALRAVMTKKPLVLGIGEAHAQRGSERIRSATHRFTHDLLPLLAPTASDLVLELMVPDGSCKKEKEKALKVQKGVVEKQAASNQNQFVELGKQAKKLTVRPHVLRPNCDELKEVRKAGPDGVAQMLTMIASLSEKLTGQILARNTQKKISKTVLLYGGALHNDIPAVEGREAWTFGPSLDRRTKGRYIALDLIVPEYIKDTSSWRALPWHPHYDRTKLGAHNVLYQTGPRTYALVFATTPQSDPKPKP